MNKIFVKSVDALACSMSESHAALCALRIPMSDYGCLPALDSPYFSAEMVACLLVLLIR